MTLDTPKTMSSVLIRGRVVQVTTFRLYLTDGGGKNDKEPSIQHVHKISGYFDSTSPIDVTVTIKQLIITIVGILVTPLPHSLRTSDLNVP